jgi:DNA invertase Pin-like site-specific DNA recombinase
MDGGEQMKIGYARVSTKGQNLDRQTHKLKKLGIEERYMFCDKDSSRHFEREQYKIMKSIIRKGDIIYIDAFDRLGRTYRDMIQEWKYFTREIEADIVILENMELFDSRKFRQMGELGDLLEDQFLSLFSYIADLEYRKIKSRQQDGIDRAKEKGIRFGRPVKTPVNKNEQLEKYFNNEQTATETFKNMGISKSKFYNMVKEYKPGYYTNK